MDKQLLHHFITSGPTIRPSSNLWKNDPSSFYLEWTNNSCTTLLQVGQQRVLCENSTSYHCRGFPCWGTPKWLRISRRISANPFTPLHTLMRVAELNTLQRVNINYTVMSKAWSGHFMQVAELMIHFIANGQNWEIKVLCFVREEQLIIFAKVTWCFWAVVTLTFVAQISCIFYIPNTCPEKPNSDIGFSRSITNKLWISALSWLRIKTFAPVSKSALMCLGPSNV
jgi:hypothetical protein